MTERKKSYLLTFHTYVRVVSTSIPNSILVDYVTNLCPRSAVKKFLSIHLHFRIRISLNVMDA
jgi:hypothetical protein